MAKRGRAGTCTWDGRTVSGEGLLQILVWSAIVIGGGRALPQAVRILRTENPVGVSPVSYAVGGAGSILWAAWGVIDHQPVLLPGNLIAVLCSVMVLRTMRRSGMKVGAGLALAGAYLLLGAGLHLGIGGLVMSLVASLSGVIFAGAGLVAFLRASDRSGVSRGTWVMVLYSELVWLAWGISNQVPASIISSGAGSGAATVILLAQVVWRRVPRVDALDEGMVMGTGTHRS